MFIEYGDFVFVEEEVNFFVYVICYVLVVFYYIGEVNVGFIYFNIVIFCVVDVFKNLCIF